MMHIQSSLFVFKRIKVKQYWLYHLLYEKSEPGVSIFEMKRSPLLHLLQSNKTERVITPTVSPFNEIQCVIMK